MKKYAAALAIVGLAAFSFFTLASTAVLAQDAVGESIDSFSSDIVLGQKGDLKIVETIVYNFGTAQRHGIYRDIPLSYNAGRDSISISGIVVTDENGNPHVFSDSKEDGYQRVKIGDPAVTVKGVKTYVIGYTVSGAAQWGEASDIIIWNATGDGWEVPISRASAELTLSADISSADVRQECYQGPYGSTESCQRVADPGRTVFALSRSLGPGEGMTISAALPKGILMPPTPLENFLDIFLVYFPLSLPVIVFVFLFRRWHKHGRDPKGRGTIVAQYEPPAGLSPIEAGVLLSTTVKSSYISAQIISLATRGFLKIVPVGEGSDKPKDYTLEKLKDATEQDPLIDQAMMSALFSSNPTFSGARDLLSFIGKAVSQSKDMPAEMKEHFIPRDSIKLSELKNDFTNAVEAIKKSVFKDLLRKEYYDSDPRKIFGKYVLVAMLVFVFAFFPFEFSPGFIGGFVLSSFIIAIFGWIMPKVTPKGAIEKENILGFRDYLSIAEKDRLNFHNAPEKRPELFEKFLPYAMALGVVDVWAKEFKDIYLEQPKWYGGSAHGPFLAAAIASDMSRFSNVAANTAFASGSSGSSGGGFSGGGAGGGGGGSW